MSESGAPAGCERDSPPGRWLARLHPDGPHTMGSEGMGWRRRTIRTVEPPEAARRCVSEDTALARCHQAVGTFQHTRWSGSERTMWKKEGRTGLIRQGRRASEARRPC